LNITQNSEEELNNLMHHLKTNVERSLERSVALLHTLRHKLILLNPAELIERHKERLQDLARQILVRVEHFIELRQAKFKGAVEKLSSLSPLNILSRGYSITFKIADGTVVREASYLKKGDSIKTRLHNGEVVSKVTEVETNGRS